MLNIDLDISVDINKKSYPISFIKRNICVHCGAENSIVFIDKFGSETRKEIHAFDHMKCRTCGRNYSIKWERDEDTGKLYPIPVELGLKQEFLNLVSLPIIKKDGEKQL